MIARITFASLALALLTIPALAMPANAAAPASVSVTVDTPSTITKTGHAIAVVKDSTGAPVAGVTLHVIVTWAVAPGVENPTVVNQLAVTTGADGVASITIPFDQSTAKINWLGDHGLKASVDGAGITDSVNYQVGTGLP